jgi:hypothetical protein
MTFNFIKGITSLVMICLASNGFARTGISFATGVMAMTNSTKQGGQGSAGSTFLTDTNFTYHGGWWGAGLFGQYDKQGDSEVDTAAGPRLEIGYDPFYLELAYAYLMNRSFTDRAIAEQTGTGTIIGVGARFALGAGGGGGGGAGATTPPGAFMQFTYKYRVQTVTKQDKAPLDEKIVQTDGYPLIGIGYGF